MAIRYLILSLTSRCNLACRYCYSGEPGKTEEMPEEVIQRAVKIASKEGDGFHLQLTGGEPTLAPESIKRAIALAKKTGRCRSLGIQTNGTSLTAEMATFFKLNRVQVGISLDGPPPVQQSQRGMAAETLRGMQLLEKENVPFTVTTVVTHSNAAVLERLVLVLAGFAQARGIGLDLLIQKGRARKSTEVKATDGLALKTGVNHMLTALRSINSARTTPIRLREQETLLSAASSGKSPFFCHACRGESMAVAPGGDIFPCGQTLNDPFFAAGTVWTPQLPCLTRLTAFHPQLSQCENCALKKICPGDCPSRLHYNRHQRPPLICDLYHAIWEFEAL